MSRINSKNDEEEETPNIKEIKKDGGDWRT